MKMTCKQLAIELGVHRSYVSRMVAAGFEMPDWNREARKIALRWIQKENFRSEGRVRSLRKNRTVFTDYSPLGSGKSNSK